jgi:hypothetical protein
VFWVFASFPGIRQGCTPPTGPCRVGVSSPGTGACFGAPLSNLGERRPKFGPKDFGLPYPNLLLRAAQDFRGRAVNILASVDLRNMHSADTNDIGNQREVAQEHIRRYCKPDYPSGPEQESGQPKKPENWANPAFLEITIRP